MQSDKDLLMLAAQAYWAGEIDDVVSIEWSDEDNGVLYTHADNQDHNGTDLTFVWNSLESGEDALRLAVKLMMSVEISEHEASTYAYAGPADRVYAMELWRNDRDAATRRAITRAAAQLAQAAQENPQ